MNEDRFADIIKGDALPEFIKPIYWDGQIPEFKEIKYNSITVCTTVMNRTQDLSQTIIKNIEDNLSYEGKKEFLILNYNSKDNLDEWIKSNLSKYIEKEIVTYYKTEEPKYYSMSHSRNICYKLASGDIVNSVDADNFVNQGFLSYVNILANIQPRKAIFAKGRRMLHGRLGFWKDECIQQLGCYDEELCGYGAEDKDLMHRAYGLGYKLMWYGSAYYVGIDSKKHQTTNFKNKDWRFTERRNKLISFFNLYYGRYKANMYNPFGEATVVKNFSEEIKI
jgi:hypothetical protein